MATYREAAEQLVDIYDFEWKDNMRMKEACISSVESVIANIVNVTLITAHAKKHLQCIIIYICILMTCIGCAKSYIPSARLHLFAICLGSIALSGWINRKYAGRQRGVGKKSDDYRKKALLIYRIITIFMFGAFIAYTQISYSFLREMIVIQSLALTAQSMALFIERNECIN